MYKIGSDDTCRGVNSLPLVASFQSHPTRSGRVPHLDDTRALREWRKVCLSPKYILAVGDDADKPSDHVFSTACRGFPSLCSVILDKTVAPREE